MAADVEGQAVEARRRGGRRAIGRVRSRADSQPWTRTTPGPGAPPRAGMNQAGSSSPSEWTDVVSYGRPSVAGVIGGRIPPRIAGPDAVGEREAVGEPDRRGRDGRQQSRPGAIVPHGRRGRHDRPTCQAPARAGYTSGRGQTRSARRPRASSRARPRPRSRPPGAVSPAPNHPDLTGDDPAASRVATRRMAEINDAYAALTRVDAQGRGRRVRHVGRGRHLVRPGSRRQRRGGPPRPKPTRPVTGRVDTSAHVPGTQPGRRQRRHGRAHRCRASRRCAARSSVGSRRAPRRRPGRSIARSGPPFPAADAAIARARPTRSRRSTFGKFHGHTLGQIAAFEPSYIDWLAGTVTRDPDLVAAARVVQADLDRRGILRRARRRRATGPDRLTAPPDRP